MRRYERYDSAALDYLFQCEHHALILQHTALRRCIHRLREGSPYGEVADWFTRHEIEAARISACACLRRMRQLRSEMTQRDNLILRPVRELAQA